MIKGIIFDLDDTLCNTSDVLDKALRNTFNEHLIHFPEMTVDDMMRVNMEAFKHTFLDPSIPVSSSTILIWLKSFELLELTPPIKVVVSLIEKIRTEISEKISLIEGAKELLEYLVKHNIKIGVLSNGAYMEQADKLVNLEIDPHISYLVTPDICLANKPEKKAFEYILDKLHLFPEEVFMVGDSIEADIVGARNAQIKGVYFQHITKRHGMEKPNADYIIHSLEEIKKLIQL